VRFAQLLKIVPVADLPVAGFEIVLCHVGIEIAEVAHLHHVRKTLDGRTNVAAHNGFYACHVMTTLCEADGCQCAGEHVGSRSET